MEIKKFYTIDELMNEAWGGAEEVLEQIIDNNKEEQFIDLFELTWGDEVPSMTTVNDWLRFEWEYIFDDLGINYNE